MILNKSGLHPLGQAVMLLPYEPDLYGKTSIIAVPDSYRARLTMVENRGIIVEIGPEAWKHEGAPRARVGDKVMVSKYAGAAAKGPLDDKVYRLVNADDIFCSIEDDIPLEQFFPELAEPIEMTLGFVPEIAHGC